MRLPFTVYKITNSVGPLLHKVDIVKWNKKKNLLALLQTVNQF